MNYKGSTFALVILTPWAVVRLESNSRPPAWQPDAQLTEQPVRGLLFANNDSENSKHSINKTILKRKKRENSLDGRQIPVKQF